MSSQVDRLGLNPLHRIIFVSGLACTYGLFHGITRGAKLASLRYLAENAHRLPKTKGAWYFFHKRKNNVVLKGGIIRGVVTALKYGLVTSLFFGTEAVVDGVNGISWVSTASSSFLLGLAVPVYNCLSWQQTLRSTRIFLIFGALAGYMQDLVRQRSTLSRERRNALANTENECLN